MKLIIFILIPFFLTIFMGNNSTPINNYIIRCVYNGDVYDGKALVHTFYTESNTNSKLNYNIGDLPFTPYVHRITYKMMSEEIDSTLSKNSTITSLIEKHNINNLDVTRSIEAFNKEKGVYFINLHIRREYSENPDYPARSGAAKLSSSNTRSSTV